MLRQLSIENYALIDSLNIDLSEGLTIITGETGAGKSVMMGAISLLMGERADSKILANREGKAIVEGVFDNVEKSLKDVFDSNELDWNDGVVIVRREIFANGRSRAFLNDTPVTLPLLSTIAGNIVDIHSQHANRLLSQPTYQLSIIDSIADNYNLLIDYKEHFAKFASLLTGIKDIRKVMEQHRESSQLRAFQLEQLSKLDPKKGELEEVERMYDLLSAADDFRERVSSSAAAISQADISAVGLVEESITNLNGINLSLFNPQDIEGETLLDRLDKIRIELKDIGETLMHISSEIDSDPELIAKTDSRLKDLYDGVKRFKVKDYDQLVELYISLKNEKIGGEENVELLNQLESEAKSLGEMLKQKAENLSKTRIEACRKFEKVLTENARSLGLKNLQVSIEVRQGKLTREGKDTVEFLCSFNKNQPLMSISQTASGGEMARLTLCIKSITASKLKLPTVIFDEIDTGVSGDIADRMGTMMADISKDMQVISITHLPQIAVKGKSHLLVYKRDIDGRTISNVKLLSPEERVHEIARMLSGKEINEAALLNAQSLLNG